MTHQHDEEIILMRNLLNRLEQSNKTGLYSLKGNITISERGALATAYNIFMSYNSGAIVSKQSNTSCYSNVEKKKQE